MANDLKFGDVVFIPHKLQRESFFKRHDGGGDRWHAWKVKPFPARKTGILIGFRTLANGTMWYGGEDGTIFTPKQYIKVALVALDSRTKPVFVLLEDVENEITIVEE